MKRTRVDVFESHEEEDEERKYFIKVVCIDGSIHVDRDFGALQNRVLRGEAWSDDDKNTISMPLIDKASLLEFFQLYKMTLIRVQMPDKDFHAFRARVFSNPVTSLIMDELMLDSMDVFGLDATKFIITPIEPGHYRVGYITDVQLQLIRIDLSVKEKYYNSTMTWHIEPNHIDVMHKGSWSSILQDLRIKRLVNTIPPFQEQRGHEQQIRKLENSFLNNSNPPGYQTSGNLISFNARTIEHIAGIARELSQQ